jgi:ABC-2 type transport system ATP-binding protein
MRTTVKVRTRGGSDTLRPAPFVRDFSEQDGMATFSVDRADLDRAMDLLTRLGIVELSVFPASLEDLFLREYQGALR